MIYYNKNLLHGWIPMAVTYRVSNHELKLTYANFMKDKGYNIWSNGEAINKASECNWWQLSTGFDAFYRELFDFINISVYVQRV